MIRGLLLILSLSIAMPAAAFNLGDFIDPDKFKRAGQVLKLVSAIVPISDEEELILGKQVAAEVITRYGIENRPKETYYLNLITTLIAQRSDRPNIAYHTAILATDDVNAYACPGGYIFVTRGALNMVHDEAELAAVLAHEISHVTEKHIVKALQQSKLMQVGADVAAEAFKKRGPLLDQMTTFATDALFKGLSKEDEYASDSKAIDYLNRVGYDYPAMFDVLDLLEQRRKQGKTKVLEKTHPSPKMREQELKFAVRKQSLEEPTGIRLPKRFAQQTSNRQKNAS